MINKFISEEILESLRSISLKDTVQLESLSVDNLSVDDLAKNIERALNERIDDIILFKKFILYI